MDSINYPAILFKEGYIYVAPDPTDLSIHRRDLFKQVSSDKFNLVDSTCALFEVVGWQNVARPRGWRGWLGTLLLSIFAAPILKFKRKMTLGELVQELGEMMLRNRMYGNAYGDDEIGFLDDLNKIRTFEEFLRFVERAP